MKIRVLAILFLAFLSCKNVTEKGTERIQIVADSTELKVVTLSKQSENSVLTSFLENPINLQKYKESKHRNYTTTSVTNGMNYYFKPKIKDSIFYRYYYPFEGVKKIDQTIVFKYGENKHTYDDETEILIELRIFNQDLNLGKANLIGLTKKELESEFGTSYLTFKNGIVYSNKNKVLILELKNSEVKSYRYIKLNTEKIDDDLIGQIIK